MFKEAVQLHYSCNCLVGGGTRYTSGHLRNMGCLLDERHVLTARHCWEEISYQYRWPVVLRQDGMFHCEVVFEDARRDVLVLRTTEQISGADVEPVRRYPQLSAEELLLGQAVGFVSSLQMAESAEASVSRRQLVLSYISMFLPDDLNGTLQFALAAGAMPSAPVGGSVFLSNGDIAGVIVRYANAANESAEHNPLLPTLPIVAPILPLLKDLRAALANPVWKEASPKV